MNIWSLLSGLMLVENCNPVKVENYINIYTHILPHNIKLFSALFFCTLAAAVLPNNNPLLTSCGHNMTASSPCQV